MVQHKPSTGTKVKKNASALKRLKTSLKEAGLTGALGKAKGSQTKKQRQGSTAIEAGKNKRGDKLALIKDAFNPFEIKASKSKHEVLGRKLKGASGRPTLSKQIGIDNRKKTLLEDFKNRNRTGAIIDRRFGENDVNMTPEEKMLERFTREKQKKARNSNMFNLEDDDEEEDLTHFGQSLAGMDTFDDPVITDDEEDKGVISQDVVRSSHFGGFEPKKAEDENRIKSKAEVMKEVIAKSKHFKHERQKAKEDDETLRMELDEGLDELKTLLLSYDSTDKPTQAPKRQPLAPQDEAFKKTIKSVDPIPEKDIKGEEYDRYIREMAFAQKAQATDRLKTEEEIAIEEKNALEKAERHRIRRMNGEDSDTEDESDRPGKRRKSNRAAQADDLDDDLEMDPEINFGLGEGVKVRVIEPRVADSDEDGSEEDSEEGSDESSGDSEEDSEGLDEEDASDLECSPKPCEPFVKTKKGKAEYAVSSSTEIPFTFPIPQTEQDFMSLVSSRSPLEHETIIKRTRVLNHPKLAPENKEKLEKFLSVLLNHLEHSITNEEFSPELINIYAKQVTELAVQLPEAAARVACVFLKSAYEEFRQELTAGESGNCPSPGQLMIFSLFIRLFSTSDYHHAVISPLQLFLGQILLQAPLVTAKCLSRSIYICGLLYETQTEAKRFVPEAIGSICNILYLLSPSATKPELASIPDFFYNSFQFEGCSVAASYANIDLPQEDPQGLSLKLSFRDLAQDATCPIFQDETYVGTLLLVTLRQLRKFAELYATLSSPLSAFPELFSPIASALRIFASSDISASIKTNIVTCQEQIESLSARCLASRFPLQLQAHRPLPIKSYLPKFDAEYSVDRYSREPNREKANLLKLQRQHKREHRGAIRELRKDSQFLAQTKLAETKRKDAEYQAKIRSITGEMANNQGDSAKFNYELKAKKGR